MTERIQLINEQVQQTLAEVLSKEAEIPAEYFISVTKISCAPNLRHAFAYVSIFPFAKAKEGLDYLNKHKKFIQGLFGEHIKLRYTPILEYRLDESEQTADEIYAIIDNL
ncbi:MAG: Ribosome-binding factor A [Parcubacteria group bacterium GW2011_GWC2_38_7]|nr:MAG: Ribosome-binding factor A [Parcubacteria group bacterium GW2011_GWC2_38_7]